MSATAAIGDGLQLAGQGCGVGQESRSLSRYPTLAGWRKPLVRHRRRHPNVHHGDVRPLKANGPFSKPSRGCCSEALDDLDKLVDSVAVAAGEVDELACLADDRTTGRRAHHGDAPSTPELE